MFNPDRLILSRQRFALTRMKLAQTSGVSPRSLTNYEKGEQIPTSETIAKLAKALKVRPEFFEGETIEVVPPEAASFRKLSKTSSAHRDAVLANASLTIRFFEAIETRFKLPLADIPSLDKDSPEQAAERMRIYWSLGDRPIANMLHLLEAKGVRVAALNPRFADIDAFCLVRDGTPYVFLNTSRSAERQRFDLAHELGHLVLHGEQEMTPSSSKDREAEANRFAASFLMPSGAILAQSMRGARIDRVLAARSFWKVSAMAMVYRLHDLSLLTDWQFRTLCRTLAEQGYRKTEPGGIQPEQSQLLRKVLYGAGGASGFSLAYEKLELLNRSELRSYVKELVPTIA